ncbi:hypothetical protein PHLCEN_2v12739 [Hermanssonia centrifuga]|uniref:Methyltransferase domain-containing protein n=1 Tax=Hermanssonia centrifuga TaxID=98765 RepID=A0A2R6NG87_9APHY|nr:hypothetical protein PHLCEN_2v12739 [Hermanssonia centrifuga]
MASPDKTDVTAIVPSNLRAPLDETMYSLDKIELEFLTKLTGIRDPEDLKKHAIAIQAEAYEVCLKSKAAETSENLNMRLATGLSLSLYPLKISRLPAYKELLRVGKEWKGALFLDIGCGVGNDLRKATADGFPVTQAIASDLRPEFWELGHKLFRSTPETFPAHFIPGDALDPAFLKPVNIPMTAPTTPIPPLGSLTSLTPLVGRLSIIHASSLFHLFNEEEQLRLAKQLGALLSPRPGSFIFGAHGGRPEKGFRIAASRPDSHGVRMFCHCPESWKRLWEKEVFREGRVTVKAHLQEVERGDLLAVDSEGSKFHLIIWSVTRLPEVKL